MQRIIIVYNPRSSKQARIREEVIVPAQKMSGYQIGKFEVKSVPVDENAKNLAQILADGDLVITAGGDGTSTVGLNAIMASGKDVTLGVLGYGNFNDFSRMLGETNVSDLISDFESGSVLRLFPLEAKLDGEHFRYAACYFTIGMFAESTEIFDAPDTRNSLKKGKKSLVFSVLKLARWYFSNKRRKFLPGDIQLNDAPMNKMKVAANGRENVSRGKKVSDVMFVNGKTVAKMMRGGDFWQKPEEYLVASGRLTGLFRLCKFMAKSIFVRLPGKIVSGETKIDFSGPEEFEIQAEGEYKRVVAKVLTVGKAERSVKVVCKN